ncbi:MAG: DNA-binding protein [Flavobacteriales bacterium]|nr:DNA-binding protein [Flavobacteriales bacterium]
MIHLKGRPYQLHVLRLTPGEDVRERLEQWATTQGIEAAAIVSAVGSLSRAVIRFAGREEGNVTDGDLEICALSGTLSKHGIHVHLSIADADGAMRGGHLMMGCTVRTTLELIVQEIGGVRFLRTVDPSTGYKELDPQTIGP